MDDEPEEVTEIIVEGPDMTAQQCRPATGAEQRQAALSTQPCQGTTAGSASGSRAAAGSSPPSTDADPCAPRPFQPKAYPFCLPTGRDSQPWAEKYSRMPPFWALLDHSLGVVWNLGVRPLAATSGIADLQWALEFVRGIHDKEGKYTTDVQAIIDAIQDQLIDKYATMDDETVQVKSDVVVVTGRTDVSATELDKEVSVTYSDMLARLPVTDVPTDKSPEKESSRKSQTCQSTTSARPGPGPEYISKKEVDKFLAELSARMANSINHNMRVLESIDRFRDNLKVSSHVTSSHRPSSSMSSTATSHERPPKTTGTIQVSRTSPTQPTLRTPTVTATTQQLPATTQHQPATTSRQPPAVSRRMPMV